MSVDNAGVLGRRIRELRKARGWSARQLAEETNGVATRCVIADLEVGRRQDLYLTVAMAIAHALGMSVEQLIDASIPPSTFSMAVELVHLRGALREALA